MISNHPSSISFSARTNGSTSYPESDRHESGNLGSRDRDSRLTRRSDLELVIRSRLRAAAISVVDSGDRLTSQLLEMLGESIEKFTVRPRSERDRIIRRLAERVSRACRNAAEPNRFSRGDTHAVELFPTLAK